MTLSLPQAFSLACKASSPLKLFSTHRATGVEQEYVVNAPFAFIGRSAAASVRLDDPSVSQGHAYLQVIEGVPFCIDLGSRTGVIWDDGTQGCGWVAPDHVIRLGEFDLRVKCSGSLSVVQTSEENHDTDPNIGPPLTHAAAEIHTAANASAKVHPLDRPITLVGRHPSCDLRLLDESIAYFQCALVNTADGVWFVDTLTRKGAILNGRGTRLGRVRDGDLLELGKLSLLFRVGIHHGNQLALRREEISAAPLDPVAAISTAVAESMAGAFAPLGEMMKQFQQCYMTMAQMFASMQQEHTMLVGEQMRQITELASELRELRADARRDAAVASHVPASPPAPSVPSPPSDVRPATPSTPRAPSLKTPVGAESQTLSDAHAWFMDRLANKGPTPPAGS